MSKFRILSEYHRTELMQEKLAEMTHWIVTQSPILLTNKSPAAINPFTNMLPPENMTNFGETRLGLIYQELCRQLFEANPNFDVLADEVQLFNEKRTIGAIDFLLKHNTQCEHWEVAIKFYLLKNKLWYGPNSQDRLDKKIHKMTTHQLKISESEQFRQRFPKLNSVIQKMLIQGRLYINPFEYENIPDKCLGYALNPSSIHGYWCYHHQLSFIKEPLYKLQKADWITNTLKKDKPYTEVMTEYSVHCKTESGQFWFIVPDTWPNAR